MGTRRKIYLITAGGFAALAIAAFAIFLSFDINSYKARISAAVSDATGIQIAIKGKIGLSLFPLSISASDVHFSGQGGEFLTADALKLRTSLTALIKRELEFSGGEIAKPHVTLKLDKDDRYNFESPAPTPAPKGPGAPFGLGDLKISKGDVVYIDEKSGEKMEFRDIDLSLKDISITDTSGNLIKNLSLSGNIACREIVQKNFSMKGISASVRVLKGNFSFIPLSASSFIYLDSKKKPVTELTGIKLNAPGLIISNSPGGILRSITFNGDIDCSELHAGNLIFSSFKSGIKAHDGIYSLTPFTLEAFGGKGEGDAVADLATENGSYKINLRTRGIDFEQFTGSFGGKKTISGRGNLTISMTFTEKGERPLLEGASGTFEIEGDSLTLHSMDLDKVLTKYETSQEFNLVDVGAYLVAGPLSTVALKGYRYGDLFIHSQGGQGTITKLVSRWRVDRGRAEALDCAFATPHHRVALKGKLNLISDRYEDVTVAILDDKGCAKFRQPITGPFGDPKIGTTVGTIESLAGPVIGLFKKAERIVKGGKCKAFYNGSVLHPK